MSKTEKMALVLAIIFIIVFAVIDAWKTTQFRGSKKQFEKFRAESVRRGHLIEVKTLNGKGYIWAEDFGKPLDARDFYKNKEGKK